MQKLNINRFKQKNLRRYKTCQHQSCQEQINHKIQNIQYRYSNNQYNFQQIRNQVFKKPNTSQFNRKSQIISYSYSSSYLKNNSILKNIIQSNQRKRNQLLNNLLKNKHRIRNQNKFKIDFLVNNKQNTKKNKRNIKTQNNQIYIQSSYNQFAIQSLRQSKNNPIKLQQKKILISQRNQYSSSPKMRISDIQYLRKTFNNKIKEIKLRKYLHKDEIETPANLFQAFGASIIGSKHQQNQDSIYFSEGIYVLCDGHGSNGKQISNFIAQTVHNSLQQCLEQNKIDQTSILQAYRKVDLQLQNSNFDISFSGCTCVALFKHQSNIYCISLGDSRAIISRGYSVHQISVTHKPDKPQQKQRIQNYGGIVHQSQVSKDKFVGPMRIWAPGKNSWGPGLALSRAFGDKASRRYGVISVPQINKFSLSYDEQFIIIGSDGLFDYFSDQDIHLFVRKLLKQQSKPKFQIPNQLINEAKKKWCQQSDDISCIIIFL